MVIRVSFNHGTNRVEPAIKRTHGSHPTFFPTSLHQDDDGDPWAIFPSLSPSDSIFIMSLRCIYKMSWLCQAEKGQETRQTVSSETVQQQTLSCSQIGWWTSSRFPRFVQSQHCSSRVFTSHGFPQRLYRQMCRGSSWIRGSSSLQAWSY